MHKASIGKRFIAVFIGGIPASALNYIGSSTDSSALSLLVFLGALGYLVLQLFYYSKGKSIGKKLMGLQVVNSATQKPIGFWRMLLRETIGKFISSFILMLGYIWAIFDDNNQAWHDKLVDSIVVEE